MSFATLISRFANSFDLGDWDGLRSVLADPVSVDYSDLRGQRARVPRSDYVEQRRSALAALTTQHLLVNREIEVSGDEASCRASGIIHRRRGSEFFDSHVIYDFSLVRDSQGWSICGIAQTVLWNEGDPQIHPGAAREPKEESE